MEIKNFEFNEAGRTLLGTHNMGKDWPVVYIIHNGTDLYIGETTSAYTRFGQHLTNVYKSYLTSMKVVFDATYNKSVILDFEQKLIKYIKADGKFLRLLNKNAGQSPQHNYYQRETYTKNFRSLWRELFKLGIVQNSIDIIENRNIFKYSPYNSLTTEQNEISILILKDILQKLKTNQTGVSLVNGCAGTGKTVLAISLINSLVNICNLEAEDFTEEELSLEKLQLLFELKKYAQTHKNLKIGFVFPMSGVRETIRLVFQEFGNGLSKEMVLSPYQLKDEEFDILFVDESHRLTKRKNLGTTFRLFDEVCTTMDLNPDNSNQLDWILKRAKYSVLFYDEDQSIKSSDITYNEYQTTLNRYVSDITKFQLTTQMRCLGGQPYTEYVKKIINCQTNEFETISNYDFKLFYNVKEMIDAVRKHDNEIGLSKTVAGYSWKWNTKPSGKPNNNYDYYNNLIKKGMYDIEIQGNKFIWNLTTEGWISRLDSHYTIGCIHTTQGFDLNYVGVIFGKEIDYNPETNQIEIDLNLFFDRNVKAGCDDLTVKRYIINTYTTMLTRGIKGCYVYACNKNLRDYLSRFIANAN